MWALSSLPRDQTHNPAMEAQSPNLWISREVPARLYLSEVRSASEKLREKSKTLPMSRVIWILHL